MNFFLKKSQIEDPAPTLFSKNIVLAETAVLANTDRAVSDHGKAIVQQVSGRFMAVPKGVRVSATNFSLSGHAVIAGSLDAMVTAEQKVEVLMGGELKGSFVGNELVSSGIVDATVSFRKLDLKSGAVCRGALSGRSITVDEGAVLEASCQIVAC